MDIKEIDKGNQIEKIKNSDNVKIVLNILDKIVAGKRFEEFDSAKQMYLLDCQCKLQDMRDGEFNESNIKFLNDSINSLIYTLIKAQNEVESVYKEVKTNGSV